MRFTSQQIEELKTTPEGSIVAFFYRDGKACKIQIEDKLQSHIIEGADNMAGILLRQVFTSFKEIEE